MTILIIEGQEHDLTRALKNAALGDLIDLACSPGAVSIASVAGALDEFNEAMDTLTEESTLKELDDVVLEFFSSVDHLQAWVAIVFLCRRKAGEQITYEDAARVGLTDVKFKRTAPAEWEAAADPKDPSTPDAAEADPEANSLT